ncbi:hypothetical protein [Aeromonas veronii]|uniref:hypothetical protein n=1 Tax=Aeromonas veronii TaxID=654 RepID=UPI001F214233|nr:hypothetical protein [Aeromonas veronii]MCF7742251.1 hypothetical protein [Aeromonas veronii]
MKQLTEREAIDLACIYGVQVVAHIDPRWNRSALAHRLDKYQRAVASKTDQHQAIAKLIVNAAN